MKTRREEEQIIARLALIGLAVCSGTRGNSLAAATSQALDALERLGASTDYRDASDSDIVAVCDGIAAGHIRCTDARWSQPMEPGLARLAWAARRSCATS